MAKGMHRPHKRILLPNDMWVLLYDDGHIKLGGYDRKMHVVEVLNRDGGTHIFAKLDDSAETIRTPQARQADFVTVPRSVVESLLLGYKAGPDPVVEDGED
ncbi:hypothetical protein ACIB24_07855 [Spongisporangium articulatum]|uniref:Uncharacterized protein n=1 Tax=Spongisporangium articulatum TaxID=3362603 RepID=A0ABW8AKR7_9ACTN